MNQVFIDVNRRFKRSDDPITALHYQLAHARAEAGLDAVVLVDDAGCLVAGAGAWPACEELAAFAPLLADPRAVKSGSVSARLAAIEAEVRISPVELDGFDALLCARSAAGAPAEVMARAAAGCRRILRA